MSRSKPFLGNFIFRIINGRAVTIEQRTFRWGDIELWFAELYLNDFVTCALFRLVIFSLLTIEQRFGPHDFLFCTTLEAALRTQGAWEINAFIFALCSEWTL